MGTNYYIYQNTCPHCGRSDKRLHIGKSSGGWCFALHVDSEKGINSLNDWIVLFPTGIIKDEYDEKITPEEMLLVITHRFREPKPEGYDWSAGGLMPYKSEEDFLSRNSAIRGPNNLIRHALSRHCIGHGEGTWDLCPGEFS